MLKLPFFVVCVQINLEYKRTQIKIQPYFQTAAIFWLKNGHLLI